MRSAIEQRGFNNRKNKDDYAIVLDIITRNSSFKDLTYLQAIGTKTYTLFELIPKEGVEIKVDQKVYIGPEKRDEIQYIKRTTMYKYLSSSASMELPFILEEIVKDKEDEFVNFLNNAGPISLRRHALEIIPGIGKKHLKDLLKIRQEKPFESFKDISERCPFLNTPLKAIVERILSEIKGKTEIKYFYQGK